MSDPAQIEQIILRFVSKEVGASKLTAPHQKYVLALYRSMNPEVFRGQKLSQVATVLGKILGSKLQDKIKKELAAKRVLETEAGLGVELSSTGSTTVDIHEYQKKALGSADQDPGAMGGPDQEDLLVATRNSQQGVESKSLVLSEFLGINDLAEFKMLFNPESNYVHYYLVLDSSYRDTVAEVPTAITKFHWKYAPTQFIGTGFCNSVGVIRDVIGMRMYQPRVPFLAAMDTDAKRVSVLIEEFAAQAFIAENGRRFHFLLRPNFIAAQTDIELSTEDYNDGIFNFRKPITSIDSMTISFGNPLTLLTFATPFNRFIIPFEFICLKSDK
jgi:hypothetical protein